MYVFYADESGFSKGGKPENQQPLTVFAGALIDLTKLSKALRIFDHILVHVNHNLTDKKVKELKFNHIKQGKYPYSVNFTKVDDKADLLEKIIRDFQREISFKVLFYSTINDKAFFSQKKSKARFTDRLKHPYLAACYSVISQVQHFQEGKKNNKGKTFFILDEQSFQSDVEKLVSSPIHVKVFSEVIDTVYFGKSHFSKLIQIADLIAGIIRFHLTHRYQQKTNNGFSARIETIFSQILQNTISNNCFKGNVDLKSLYSHIEIKNP